MINKNILFYLKIEIDNSFNLQSEINKEKNDYNLFNFDIISNSNNSGFKIISKKGDFIK